MQVQSSNGWVTRSKWKIIEAPLFGGPREHFIKNVFECVLGRFEQAAKPEKSSVRHRPPLSSIIIRHLPLRPLPAHGREGQGETPQFRNFDVGETQDWLPEDSSIDEEGGSPGY